MKRLIKYVLTILFLIGFISIIMYSIMKDNKHIVNIDGITISMPLRGNLFEIIDAKVIDGKYEILIRYNGEIYSSKIYKNFWDGLICSGEDDILNYKCATDKERLQTRLLELGKSTIYEIKENPLN